MRLFLLISFLLILTIQLPYVDKVTLANSLVVGRPDKAWTCKVCDQSNKPLSSHYIHHIAKDVKCILSTYKDFVVLGFRYTNSAKNVWQDILYPFQIVDENTCPQCKVQKVYNNMWDSLRYNVTQDLIKINLQTGIQTLYITGISLGGGLAFISYVDILNDELFKNVHVVTYGSPRVGNKYWAEWFEKKSHGNSIRYSIKGDPVVVLPECFTRLCDYKHVGKKIVCYQKTKTCNLQKDYNVNDPNWQRQEVDKDITFMSSFMQHAQGYPKIYNYTLIMEYSKPKSLSLPQKKPKLQQ